MANPRSSKRALEKARQERAAMKRDRRQGRAPADALPDDEVVDAVPVSVPIPEADVLAELAELHGRFARGAVAFADFEAAKDELMRRLHVD